MGDVKILVVFSNIPTAFIDDDAALSNRAYSSLIPLDDDDDDVLFLVVDKLGYFVYTIFKT